MKHKKFQAIFPR